jgi:hypothetical protein
MKQTNEGKPWCVSYFLVWSMNVNLFSLSLKQKERKKYCVKYVQMPNSLPKSILGVILIKLKRWKSS